jgi:hypothetical protein
MDLQTLNELPNVFQGSEILPSQYNDLCRRGTSLEAESRLLFALLEDGIRCYMRYRGAQRNSPRRLEFIEAFDWINSEVDEGPFAFVNVCETLGIDPSRLRDGIDKHRRMLKEPDLGEPLRERARLKASAL